MEEAPLDGKRYVRKDGAWIVLRESFSEEYSFNLTLTAPPAGGQVRLNNATQDLATLMWVSGTTAPGMNVFNVIKHIALDTGLYLQDKDNSDIWAAYNVTADAIDRTDYVEVPVVFHNKGPAGPLVAQRVLLISMDKFA